MRSMNNDTRYVVTRCRPGGLDHWPPPYWIGPMVLDVAVKAWHVTEAVCFPRIWAICSEERATHRLPTPSHGPGWVYVRQLSREELKAAGSLLLSRMYADRKPARTPHDPFYAHLDGHTEGVPR
jgi:hypothetical protein